MAKSRICSIPNCGKPYYGHGWCSMHHQRWLRHGTTDDNPKPTQRERFEDKYIPEPNSGCWIWIAGLSQSGYGSFDLTGAHRVSYELYVAPIPPNGHVLHRCDNRCCVNPDHLYIGDFIANMKDMVSRGRSLKGERNKNSKLTDEQVRTIRSDPRTQMELAAEYGVSQVLISKIRRRANWTHVD